MRRLPKAGSGALCRLDGTWLTAGSLWLALGLTARFARALFAKRPLAANDVAPAEQAGSSQMLPGVNRPTGQGPQ